MYIATELYYRTLLPIGGGVLPVAGLAVGVAVLALMASVAIGGNLPNLVGDYPKASRNITTGNPGGCTSLPNFTTELYYRTLLPIGGGVLTGRVWRWGSPFGYWRLVALSVVIFRTSWGIILKLAVTSPPETRADRTSPPNFTTELYYRSGAGC
jgi:hypothetical protein